VLKILCQKDCLKNIVLKKLVQQNSKNIVLKNISVKIQNLYVKKIMLKIQKSVLKNFSVKTISVKK